VETQAWFVSMHDSEVSVSKCCKYNLKQDTTFTLQIPPISTYDHFPISVHPIVSAAEPTFELESP